MEVKRIGIDLAKRVFQLCGVNQAGTVVFNRQVKRERLLAVLRQYPGATLVMEACFSAHYWGRTFEAQGHRVLLIPPQHVKPFLRVHKSDARDALAIVEAAARPGLHGVPVKSVAQQDLQTLHRVRSRCVRQRTALANQIRGIANEYGVCFPQCLRHLRAALPLALEDATNGLSPVARATLAELGAEWRALDARVERLTAELLAQARSSPAWQRLQRIPGYGPLAAAAVLAAIGTGQQFRQGRAFAAWLGLVPRQRGTGGRTQLLGITKNGDRYLRTLLIHGARAVVHWCDRRTDALGRWVRALKARRGLNKTVVALANKCARIAWHCLARDEDFDLRKAFA